MLTAGHCVYDTDSRSFFRAFLVTPGLTGGRVKPYGAQYAKYVDVKAEYRSPSVGGVQRREPLAQCRVLCRARGAPFHCGRWSRADERRNRSGVLPGIRGVCCWAHSLCTMPCWASASRAMPLGGTQVSTKDGSPKDAWARFPGHTRDAHTLVLTAPATASLFPPPRSS